jgi:DNA end-binding protein Ku
VIDLDELEPFIPAAMKTIDLEKFVDLDQIDPIYFETPYYLAPHLSPKPYVLLARGLESSGKVAIARFVMRNRQYTAAVRAENSRLIMSTLVYADEVVPVDEVEELTRLGDVAVADREVKMAEMLIELLTGTFDRIKVRGWPRGPSWSSGTPGCQSTARTRSPRRCRPRPSRPSASSRAGSSST